MPEFGMREARKELARLIERAQYGEEVVITRDGIPVARLEPIRRGRIEAPVLADEAGPTGAEADPGPTETA